MEPPKPEVFEGPLLEGPLLAYGEPIVITGTSLLIDRHGVGWWIVIDDDTRAIIKAFA